MFQRNLLVFVTAFMFACSGDAPQDKTEKDLALSVIDSAIAFYSDGDLKNKLISFEFRTRNYSASWPKEGMLFTNSYKDSIGSHERHLQNGVYQEWLNGMKIQLDEKSQSSRGSSLNSVMYFALLPWNLHDDAVKSSYLGEATIDSKRYFNVKVTFEEEGGGEDFDDVFLYWFDIEDYSMDYFAYSYREDEGGTRFRSAMNVRRINDVVFQDYNNYKGPSDPDSLHFILDLYEQGELELLSQIKLSKIQVRLAEKGN